MERKLILLFIVICFSFSSVFAQLNKVQVDSLSYVNYYIDTLVFDKQNSLLLPFFDKYHELLQTKKGNINIVHLGSSHVQAGTMSHAIRRDLLFSSPDLIGPRGMIFPYGVANKCNNPHDYRTKRSCEFSLIRCVYKEHTTPLGLCGLAVYVENHPAEFKVTMTDPDLQFCTDRIVLLGESTDSTAIPLIRVDTTCFYPEIRDFESRRFVFNNVNVTDSFVVVIPCDTGQRFAVTGIFLDNDAPGVTFHSLGANGASLSDYLRCPYYEKDLELIQPDMVIFGIGINDAFGPNFDTLAFANKYRQLIQKVKNVNPECAFVFITNNDAFKRISRRKYIDVHNNVLAQHVFYRLAAETKGAVWDQFAIMGGERSMNLWRTDGYAQNDRVHFTVKGYQLLGNLFFNAFVDAYNKKFHQKD